MTPNKAQICLAQRLLLLIDKSMVSFVNFVDFDFHFQYTGFGLSGKDCSLVMKSSTLRNGVAVSLVALWFFAVLSGCNNPLREEAITELGGELSGVPIGPLHRAGQPCLMCHDGSMSTAFSVAGTIHLRFDGAQPAASALVHLADGLGNTYRVATNCAGNFFVRPGDYEPVWPLWVRVEHEDWAQEMDSPVNSDGSCAGCHRASPSPDSAGPIYVNPFEGESEVVGCP